jgi:regulator of sirC expression with transglutaminase-like and TPR domain
MGGNVLAGTVISMVDDMTARFAELVARQDHPLPVDEALLLIAAHADPNLDIEAQKRRLDELAAQVEEPTVEGLCHLLFERLGFAGDHRTYYAAENSLLPCVLDRRLGIPLSLSLLTIEVGRRCDVKVDGIGMPGHYLVRPAGQTDRYVDVYDGGRVLDVDGCHELFERVQAGVPWDVKYLRPDAPWARVSRTLGNLAGAYRRSGDRDALRWTLQLSLLLPSGSDRERRELGLLLGAAGRYAEAATVLEGSGTEADAEAALRMRARLN